ncbi:hypothetical protein KBD33_02135 [Candidatus Gracilibacteria bacterium]|nr:hypothetical protein [Candidatus Gracilibacteria bacterium]
MSSSQVEITPVVSDGKLVGNITFYDPSFIGKKAIFSLNLTVDVHDSRGINSSKDIFTEAFIITESFVSRTISFENKSFFTYHGEHIDIDMTMKCRIDDGIFFDTKVGQEIVMKLIRSPGIALDAPGIIEPNDAFNLINNLRVLPVQAQLSTIGLMIVGGIVIINMLIGAHDQSVSPQEIWLYSQIDSDGETTSPFINALLTSSPIGLFVWYMIKKQLRKYMTFFWKKEDFSGEKGLTYNVREYIGGKSRVDLTNVTLRIVAANIEKGQYERGSGTKTRTVSFSNPVRAIVLYSKQYDLIPKDVDIDTILSGSFTLMICIEHSTLNVSHHEHMGGV